MLNFFRKLQKISKTSKNIDLLTFYIECNKCKEKIKVLINKKTDLMNQYKESDEKKAAYILKKEVLGNNCPNLMYLNVEFDKDYNIIHQSVENGHSIEE